MPQLGRTTIAMAAACPYQARISKLGASTRPRVLVPTSGSGNFGEQGASAFWTIDELPGALRNMAEGRSGKSKDGMERVDVDLGPNRCAFTVDHILSGDEADALAACAEAILDANGHSRVAPGINTPPGILGRATRDQFEGCRNNIYHTVCLLKGVFGRDSGIHFLAEWQRLLTFSDLKPS